MPRKHKRSFFERLTGVVRLDDEEKRPRDPNAPFFDEHDENATPADEPGAEAEPETYWRTEPDQANDPEGELPIDMHETAGEIILKTFVAGVSPDDMDITITREMVTIRGERSAPEHVVDTGYVYQELYWGPFSRSVVLPQEIEVEEAEATERYGLLTLKLPKINKDRETKIRVKAE